MSDHVKGLLITFLGVCILGPDTLFIRLVDESAWMVLLWRGAFMAVGTLLITLKLDPQPLSSQFKSIGTPGFLIALFFAGSSICFVNAVQYTTIANTLIIVSASPIIAAFLGWIFLKEHVSLISMLAIALVLVGVAMVVQGGDPGYWLGDLCAAGSAVFIALTFVTSRKAKHINMLPAMVLSGILLVLLMVPLVDMPALKPESILYLVILGLITTCAFSLLIIGPRYLPAHDVSLMMPLETVFGVALAWWFLQEIPSLQSIAGGMLVLITLAVYALLRSRQSA